MGHSSPDYDLLAIQKAVNLPKALSRLDLEVAAPRNLIALADILSFLFFSPFC